MAETFPNTTRTDVSVAGSVTGVAWSHDGSHIAVTSGANHHIDVMDPDGKVITEFKRQFNGPNYNDAVLFTKDLVILPPESIPPYIGQSPDALMAVSLWNANTGHFVKNIEGPAPEDITHGYNWMGHGTLSPDGSMMAIATGQTFAPVFLYHTKDWTFQKFFAFKRPDGMIYGATDIRFSNDNKTLVIGNRSGQIEVADIDSGKLIRLIDAFGETAELANVSALALSPDGKYAVVGCYFGAPLNKDYTGNGNVRIFDLQTGERIAIYSNAIAAIRKLDWNASGDTIAIASNDHTLHLWKWHTSQPPEILSLGDSIMSLAYSPDGKKLAVGHGTTVSIFNFNPSTAL
jgi:hypothetical protein